nr:MBL fold metallo-hydrolase [Ardenticatena sp.]
MTTVHTLDLNFQGFPGTIAAYLIPHARGAVLIETGPGTTTEALEAGVRVHGFTMQDITDVLLTHIHLDHAGAVGWMAQHGARVHVHPRGAPHLINPERLLASAERIYGDDMDRLWGAFLPVPAEQVHELADNMTLHIEDLTIEVLETVGHANHHVTYRLGETIFTGDVGGMRFGNRFVSLPMPPPEFHIERWRASLDRLQRLEATRIAPTHFGVYDDVAFHLAAARDALDAAEAWLVETMRDTPDRETLRERFTAWIRAQAEAQGLDEAWWRMYEVVSPPWMSADGMYRYWHKYRVRNA